MDSLIIPSTLITPAIQFDAETGVFSIKGCSIPVEADNFWKPRSYHVLKFIPTCLSNPHMLSLN